METSNEDWAFIAVFAIIGSLVLLTVAYAVAIIAFNIKKKADRAIKLTSPNLNVIICSGGVLGALALLPLGMDRPILGAEAVDTIIALKKAALCCLCLSITFMFGTSLVKMWRVHNIFKKMNISQRMTKDEHLLLVVILFACVDVVLLSVWLKVDPLTIDQYLPSATPEEMQQELPLPLMSCGSHYLHLWVSLTFAYKVILVLSPAYYAWQTRQVKLPSLQDSIPMLANTCVVLGVGVVALPAALSSGESGAGTARFATLSLAVIVTIVSTLSWMSIPKFILVRSKKDSSDPVKFLFSESLKQKGGSPEEKPPLKFLCLTWNCGGDNSSLTDSVLIQEIDTLKSLLKEKDKTIRDLTNRLFFGPDRFNDYLQEKSTQGLQRAEQLMAPDNSRCPTIERSAESASASKNSVSGSDSMSTLDRSQRRAARLQRIHAASPVPSSLLGSGTFPPGDIVYNDHPSSASNASYTGLLEPFRTYGVGSRRPSNCTLLDPVNSVMTNRRACCDATGSQASSHNISSSLSPLNTSLAMKKCRECSPRPHRSVSPSSLSMKSRRCVSPAAISASFRRGDDSENGSELVRPRATRSRAYSNASSLNRSVRARKAEMRAACGDSDIDYAGYSDFQISGQTKFSGSSEVDYRQYRPAGSDSSDCHDKEVRNSRSKAVQKHLMRNGPLSVASPQNSSALKHSKGKNHGETVGITRSPTPTADSAIGHSDQEEAICHNSYSPLQLGNTPHISNLSQVGKPHTIDNFFEAKKTLPNTQPTTSSQLARQQRQINATEPEDFVTDV